MKKEEENSSLEMLLDTMCNTFGGVMFIAITLAVVLFSRDAVQQTPSAKERIRQQREDLLQQIDALRARLAEQTIKKKEITQAYLLLENDPRLKSLRQIAALEELTKSAKAHLTILAKELAFLETETQTAEGEKQKMVAQQQEMESNLLALTSKIESDKQQLDAITESMSKVNPLSMTFTVLEKHNDRPSFFILLRKGSLWSIGPGTETDEDGIPLPTGDVTYKVQDDAVICTPKENAGVPALAGDNLSPECLALLKQVPADRGAMFGVAAEDAETFYKMREQLKKKGIFHGFGIQEQNDTFTYYFTKVARYEY